MQRSHSINCTDLLKFQNSFPLFTPQVQCTSKLCINTVRYHSRVALPLLGSLYKNEKDQIPSIYCLKQHSLLCLCRRVLPCWQLPCYILQYLQSCPVHCHPSGNINAYWKWSWRTGCSLPPCCQIISHNYYRYDVIWRAFYWNYQHKVIMWTAVCGTQIVMKIAFQGDSSL